VLDHPTSSPDSDGARPRDLLTLGSASTSPKADKGEAGEKSSERTETLDLKRDDTKPRDDSREDPENADTRRTSSEAGEGSNEHGSITGGKAFIRRHPVGVAIGAILVIAAIAAGVLYYLHARNFESTDDAFIDSRPVSISPEVTGSLVEVRVNDNQVVKAGDVLARIDDRDYRAAVDNAQAQIEQADASIANFNAQISAQQSQIDQAKKQVSEAQAALAFSRAENARYQELERTGAGTVQRAQQAQSDLQQKQAQLDAAEASEAAAEKQINVLRAQVHSAMAQRDQAIAQKAQADANLSRTILHATMDGRVTRLTGAVGQVATSQSALMVLVPLDVWVTANFKETQLTLMKPGQPASIEIDALGRTFRGHVDSLQAGSGTAFSLLPAENATGNYVKVVQRIPVKIIFDQRPDAELGPGMSVVPTVTVR
jgi:membrane fusion protein (multidrug efflux system)